MKNFVFRNHTIEGLFSNEYAFSGYDQFLEIPTEASNLIWFYQCPIKSSANQILAEIQEYKSRIDFVLSQKSDTCTFIYISTEIIEYSSYNFQSFEIKKCLQQLNAEMYDLAATNKQIKFVDFSEFIQQINPEERIDWKFYYYSQSIINPKLSKRFKLWWATELRKINSQRKKCLVLDLDNTLWHGVLGEDGIFGIKCGNDYPGKAFRDFQKALLEATKNGVILALCSKNNEEDVLELWEKNSDVLIKNDAVAAYRINWNNKANNIEEIADELNIGLDSLVFIDDNPFERENVKLALKDVVVPDFPEKPFELLTFFNKIYNEYFGTYQLTEEDLKKTKTYQENAARVTAKRSFNDIGEYLRSLKMDLTIRTADAQTIARISQMTQKTNQFNLTTQRYTEQEILELSDKGSLIVTLGVKDKFGDNGITALAIVKTFDDIAVIDSYLLSCRVLGRGIENVFLKWIENNLLEKNIKIVNASYIPSQKNRQTECFFESNGYTLSKESEGIKNYTKNLVAVNKIEDYYKISEYEPTNI